MKLLYTNNDIKLMSDNVLKEYKQFILCDDDDAENLKQSGYIEISELFDINKIQSISNAISSKIDSFSLKITEFNDILKNINNTVSYLDELKLFYDEKISELTNFISKLKEQFSTINSIYDKIISIDKSYTNEIEQYRSKLIELSSEKIEDFNTILSNIDTQVSESIKPLLQEKNEYKKLLDDTLIIIETKLKESENFALESKKWACNPVNVSVKDGLYSSRHYAEINKGK